MRASLTAKSVRTSTCPHGAAARDLTAAPRRAILCTALTMSMACAGPAELQPPRQGGALVQRAGTQELPCILVAPFVNFSDVSGAALAVSSRLTVELGAHFAHEAVDGRDIAAALGTTNETGKEDGVLAGAMALEMGRLVGADAVLFGALGGTWQRHDNGEPTLLLDARLVRVASREIVWAASRVVRPALASGAEGATTSVELAASELVKDMLANVPSRRAVGPRACFAPLTLARRAGSSAVAGDETSAATSPSVPTPRGAEHGSYAAETEPRRSRAARRGNGKRRRGKRGRSRSEAPTRSRSRRVATSAQEQQLAALYHNPQKSEAPVVAPQSGGSSGDSGAATVSRAELDRVVAANRRDVVWCVEVAALVGAQVSGKLEIRLTTDGDGRVVQSEVVSTTLKDEAVAECVERRLRGWTFPGTAGQSQTFVLPFVI